jgi:hypothetical protein
MANLDKKSELTAELVTDKNDPSIYRVEAIDDDGGCEVAIFGGPRALERARFFAESGYYAMGAVPPSSRIPPP